MPARHPALYPGAYATDAGAARQPDHSAAAAAAAAACGWKFIAPAGAAGRGITVTLGGRWCG